GPVDLVKIYPLHFEPAQTVFAFFPDTLFGESSRNPTFAVPDKRTLCRDDDILSSPLEGPCYHLFCMSKPIYGGGVYPINSEVQPLMDGRNRLVVILFSP